MRIIYNDNTVDKIFKIITAIKRLYEEKLLYKNVYEHLYVCDDKMRFDKKKGGQKLMTIKLQMFNVAGVYEPDFRKFYLGFKTSFESPITLKW